ncbi:alkaline phosphatase family protein [Aneurinibacillus danicus]|uniref:alkaline phosphatase family protein n=1 Tax=Aneurinibacillus danicus TaxID=267746 RepID=UPI0014787BE9|nr:alkaline phosphatase family protein [Aneurinibacillus danicus]
MGKKIVLILIDSLMPHILREAQERELVPALSLMMSRGAYWNNCATIFPTMSASVDASLITGVYPEEHRIPGLVWYSRKERRIVNYINGSKSVWRIGVKKCTQDVLIEMNEKHMSRDVSTLFEEVTRRGKTSASFNFAAHRGPHYYRVQKPGLSKLFLAGLLSAQVSGPEICTVGKFIDSTFLRSLRWNFSHTIFHKYGLNDRFAVDAVCKLIREGKLPHVTFVYMPDMDYAYHRNPERGPQILARADRYIQRLLDSFGNADEAFKQCKFIVVGDHGQTKIGIEKEATINVEQHLLGMKIARAENIQPEIDDIVICNNERMCYFYPLKEGVQQETVKRLLMDLRIDILAWKEGRGVWIGHGGQTLFFAPGQDIHDQYGRQWKAKGDFSIIDAVLGENPEDGTPVISFGRYPDLFSRLYGALYAQEGEVIVATAQPGCEFFTPSDPVHRGGASHGSLHEMDSIVSLIITDESPDRFSKPRIVDIKSYILRDLC